MEERLKRVFWIASLGFLFLLTACNPLRYVYTPTILITPSPVLGRSAKSLDPRETEVGFSTAIFENTLRIRKALISNLDVELLGSQRFFARSWDGFLGLNYNIVEWNGLDLGLGVGNHVSYSEWNGGYLSDYIRVPLVLSWQLPDSSWNIAFSPQFWFETVGIHLSDQSALPTTSLMSWHFRVSSAVKELGENSLFRTGFEISYMQPLGNVDVSALSAQLLYIGIDVNYHFGKSVLWK